MKITFFLFQDILIIYVYKMARFGFIVLFIKDIFSMRWFTHNLIIDNFFLFIQFMHCKQKILELLSEFLQKVQKKILPYAVDIKVNINT